MHTPPHPHTPPRVTQTRSPGFNKINSAGQATSAGPMEKWLLKFIAAAPRVGRGQWKMLPNLPSLIRPGCGDGDPGRRLYQRGREIKNAVPPAARLTPAWRYRRAPRRLKGIWGHRSARRPSGKARAVGRIAHRCAPPVRVSPPPGQAARSRGEPPLLLTPRVGEEADGDGAVFGAGGDLPSGAGGQAEERFFWP